MVDAHVKVVVRHVRLETRVVKQDLVTQHLIRGHLGETQPHLVFNFNINVDGTVNKFDVHKLKLTGCAVQLLGRFKYRTYVPILTCDFLNTNYFCS